MKSSHETGSPEPTPNTSESALGNAILLVEDEPEIRDFLLQMLESQGYVVQTAANGDEAMQKAVQDGAGKIDLLIADLVMPKVGGLELASWFRGKFPESKILIISGYTNEMVIFDEELSGKTSFLSKPLRPEPFKAKVAELLKQ